MRRFEEIDDKDINERSFGVIPISIRHGSFSVLLVQHLSGAWLFPKGKMEKGEDPKETAERELKEETGLEIEKWADIGPFRERYRFFRSGKKIYKEVLYFPAFVKGEVVLQLEELRSARWERVEMASLVATFSEMKKIAQLVCDWVYTHSS